MAIMAVYHFLGLSQDSHYLNLFFMVVALIMTYSFTTTIYHAYFGPLSRIPGPKLRAISILPHCLTNWAGENCSTTLALHDKYGPVVRMAPAIVSFAGDAEAWKAVYGFKKHGELENQKDPRFYDIQVVKGAFSLLNEKGKAHGRQRKLLSHAFSDKALKEQEPLLRRWANTMQQVLAEQAQRDVKINMVSMLNFTTFDIMADLTFAEPLYMLDNGSYVPWVKTIFGNVKAFTKLQTTMLLHPFIKMALNQIVTAFPQVRKMAYKHFRYTADRVDKRLATKPDRPDIWTRILEKAGDPRKHGSLLTLGEHYVNADLFMIAGTETTATALSGTLFYLLQNPEIMKDLLTELRTTFKSVDDMGLESLGRLPLLDAVIKEGLRVYPPTPIGLPRIAPVGGCTIGNYYLPQDTQISVHQYATFHSERNFKNASQFRPSRWMGAKEYENDRLDCVEPFQVGPRACLGRNLAWHEMRLLLATVLVHFDVELCPESQDWIEQKVFTLWEKNDLLCKLTPVQKM